MRSAEGQRTFDVASACAAAREGVIKARVDDYLRTGRWANVALADGLRLQKRWWRGPLEYDLDRLQRCYGPEANMEIQADEAAWEGHIAGIAASLTDPRALPPLIAMHDEGTLSVRDGNHRHEALRRRGWTRGWVLVWYNMEQDFAFHGRQLVGASQALDSAQT
jgi:hypothetical protein